MGPEEFLFREEKSIKIDNGIIPIISFPYYMEIKGNHERVTGIEQLNMSAKLALNHNFIALAEPDHMIFNFFHGSGQMSLTSRFLMDRVTIESIEKNRVNDLSFQVSLYFNYKLIYEDENDRNKKHSVISKYSKQLNYDISQNQWIDLLQKMGYGGYWIFEVPKIEIDGLEDLEKHLLKAKNNLINNQFEDCMANIRSAWNVINPIIDENKEALFDILDKYDKQEEGFPPKSKRVMNLIKVLNNFVQVGVHRETYDSTPIDAELSYYQTLTMFYYLNNQLKKILNNGREELK